MKTLLITEIVNMSGIMPMLNLPDHSIILGTFSTSNFDIEKNCQAQNANEKFKSKNVKTCQPPKKNIRKINETFFMSEEITNQVIATISKLENVVNDQSELDSLWSQVKDLLLCEISTLPDLPTSNCKKLKTKFRKSQPFWNENLEAAWKDVCNAERDYLMYKTNVNSQLVLKNSLNSAFKNCQKIFDSKFRYFKRRHKKQEFF